MAERFRDSFGILPWTILTLFAAPLQAQTRPVTLAWDPSPDPTVIGYVVYVGTEPDAPREGFEVSGTSFVYPNAASDQPYFFSVAAYSEGPLIGSRSEEVLFLDGGDTLVSASNRAADAPRIDHGNGRTDTHAAATRSQPGSSSTAVASVGDFGHVDSLKALGDGRLIFIENGARIVIVDPEREDIRVSAAVTGEGVRFTSLAVDPQFVVTHLIYAVETDTSADGAAQVSIARYREVGGRLGERAVVISGLAALRDGNALIALDASGHLFVALPRTDSNRVDSYAGMILRFGTDGTVPADNRAVSPLFARGVSQPTALEWDPSGNSLWLADARSQLVTSLRRVRLDRESAEWPRNSEIVDAAAHDGADLSHVAGISFGSSDLFHGVVVAGQPAALLVITEGADGVMRTMPLPGALLEGEPMAVARDRGDLDVAVRVAGANSGFTTRIVRLRSVSSGY